MQQIPINPVPNQTLQVVLNGQSCVLNIYQLVTGLFIDVYVNDELIIGGVICQNLNSIVRDAYLGFSGDLSFLDTQSQTDPQDPIYTGLGARFELWYLSPTDLAS